MLPVSPMPMQPVGGQSQQIPGAEKKLAAGLCGILVGGFGVHKFVLGYQKEGIIMLSVNLVSLILFMISCGILFPLIFVSMAVGIVGLVEGIMYLTKSDEEFVQTYIVNKKPWF
jgi:TM2 domain-containing membrane protein YozV